MARPGRWAVVGLTGNTARPVHSVAKRIRDDLGMTIVPVNPKGEPVHGEPGHRTLAEVPGPIDVVDCFVNSRRVGAVVDQAIAVAPPRCGCSWASSTRTPPPGRSGPASTWSWTPAP